MAIEMRETALEEKRKKERRERQWRLDHSMFAAAKKEPENEVQEGVRFIYGARGGARAVSVYYRRQNEMIDGFSEMDALSEHFIPPTDEEKRKDAKLKKSERNAILLSNVVNVFLLVAKVICSIKSRSLAVIASTLDSLLDLLSGFILWYTARAMRKENPYKYPIGKNRMQPLGIIVFASIMAALGLQVVIEGLRSLISRMGTAGFGQSWPYIVGIMGGASVIKLGLFLYCTVIANEIVQAYAMDHFFDVVTNVVGLAAALLAHVWLWWVDPLGAILLALYTIINWGNAVRENVNSLTGFSAPPEFLQKLTYLCWNHHEAIQLIDTVRAYTFGSHYFTEVDVVLPPDMPLKEAHDIGEALQNKLERLPEIERAFVHLDYEVSHRPEHHHGHSTFHVPATAQSSFLAIDDKDDESLHLINE